MECFFRRLEYYDEESDRVLVFLDQSHELAAATVAAVYRLKTTDRGPIMLTLGRRIPGQIIR
jgi:hypothetical protein